MSPSQSPRSPKRRRRTHIRARHPSPFVRSKAEPTSNLPAHAHPLVRHIIALEAIGWRVVQLRPLPAGGEIPLWYVAITRVDLDASMTMSAADPDVALAELVRYASADATEVPRPGGAR